MNKLNNTVKLWARVGMTLEVPVEIYEQLQSGNKDALMSVFHGETGTFRLDGETYFPDTEINRGLEDMEFDLYDARPMLSAQKATDVKVMVEGGIVHAVLKNSDAPIHVEVVDVDTDYEDYEALKAYQKEIYDDPSFVDCDYNVTNFEEDLPETDISFQPSQDEATVYIVAGSVKHEIYSGTMDECEQFCEEKKWSFVDEHCFVWDLEIEENEREETHAHPSLADTLKEAERKKEAQAQPSGIQYRLEDTVISYSGVAMICHTNPVGEPPYETTERSIITTGIEERDIVLKRHAEKLDVRNRLNARTTNRETEHSR